MGGINTMRAEIVGSGGTPIAGYSWPVAAMPFEEMLCSIYPNDIAAYASAGRIKVSDSPVTDADASNPARRWTAQSVNISRQIDSGVLGGLPRWQGVSEGGFDNGLFASLDASLTDYSMVVLARVTTGGANRCLVNIGPSTSDRVMLYTGTTDLLSIQHNSTDIKAAASAVTIGDWLPIVVSYQESTKAMRVYMGSTTPVISSTMTNSPTTSRLASLMMTRENTTELTGELALAAIWGRALHLDSAALATAITAINGLAAL